MEQRSPAWFEARCGRITGSRFAEAMAARNTQKYRGLLENLVRERVSKQVSRGYVSSAMQWGIDHEDNARRWYAKAHNCVVNEIGFVVHPQFEFVGVSPDGLVSHDGLIEIKCPQLHNYRKVADSRQLPSQYRWQVQGQLWVCQRKWLHFVCFYPPGHGTVVPVFGSAADFDRLAERCTEIDREVQKRMSRYVIKPNTQATATVSMPARTSAPQSRPDSIPQMRALPEDKPRNRGGSDGFQWWMLWAAIVLCALIRAAL